MIYTLFSLCLFSTTICIISDTKKWEVLCMLSLAFAIATGVTSLICCGVYPHSDVIEPATIKVMKNERVAVADDGKNTYEFKLYSEVNSINDSTKFEYIIHQNFFGGEVSRELKIKK